MSEKEKKILETFSEVLPKLTELEQEKLLSFGEGMAFKVASHNTAGKEVSNA